MDIWKIKYVDELKNVKKWFENFKISDLLVKNEFLKNYETNLTAKKWLNELNNQYMTIQEWAEFLNQKESSDKDSKMAKYIITRCIWLIIKSKMHDRESDYYNESKGNFLNLINCREEMLKRCFTGNGDNPIDIKRAIESFDTMHFSDLISQKEYEIINKGYLEILRDMSVDNFDSDKLYTLFNFLLVSDKPSKNDHRTFGRDDAIYRFDEEIYDYYVDKLKQSNGPTKFFAGNTTSSLTIQARFAEDNNQIEDRGNYLYLKSAQSGSYDLFEYIAAIKEALYCINNQHECYRFFKEKILIGLIQRYCKEYAYGNKSCVNRLNYLVVILFEHLNDTRFDGEIPNIVSDDFLDEIERGIRGEKVEHDIGITSWESISLSQLEKKIYDLIENYKEKLDFEKEDNKTTFKESDGQDGQDGQEECR